MPDLIKVQFNEVLTQIQHVYQQLNSTLIKIYWNVGKYISEQVKKNANWRKGVVTELANFFYRLLV